MKESHLKQAKKRNTKIEITEVAIEKVPFIEYKGFTEKQNQIIYRLIKEVLFVAKEQNHSNEAAITCAMTKENTNENLKYSIVLGDEHSVNIMSDSDSYHMIMNLENVTVVILHNHPSTKTFSLEDLLFFVNYDSIKMIAVVTNQGSVHYLIKEKNYNMNEAIALCRQYYNKMKEESDIESKYAITLELLKHCKEVGLLYK